MKAWPVIDCRETDGTNKNHVEKRTRKQVVDSIIVHYSNEIESVTNNRPITYTSTNMNDI